MKTYNRIMLFFWLIMTVILAVFVTVKCLTENFQRWAFMYIFVALSLFMFVMKRWMVKRYNRNMGR